MLCNIGENLANALQNIAQSGDTANYVLQAQQVISAVNEINNINSHLPNAFCLLTATAKLAVVKSLMKPVKPLITSIMSSPDLNEPALRDLFHAWVQDLNVASRNNEQPYFSIAEIVEAGVRVLCSGYSSDAAGTNIIKLIVGLDEKGHHLKSALALVQPKKRDTFLRLLSAVSKGLAPDELAADIQKLVPTDFERVYTAAKYGWHDQQVEDQENYDSLKSLPDWQRGTLLHQWVKNGTTLGIKMKALELAAGDRGLTSRYLQLLLDEVTDQNISVLSDRARALDLAGKIQERKLVAQAQPTADPKPSAKTKTAATTGGGGGNRRPRREP